MCQAQFQLHFKFVDGDNGKWPDRGPALLRTRSRGMGLIEFLFCPGPNFVQFCVQPSDFGIQFDKTQTLRGDQPFSLHACVVLAHAGYRAYACGWLLGSGVALQVDQIEA